MAKVQGTVEAVSHKFDKFSILVGGTWYATKQEYVNFPEPSKGDNVEFDNGGGKFLKKLRIIGSSTGSAPVTAGSKGNTNPNLGIELGHASNLGMELAIAEANSGSLTIGDKAFYERWTTHTENIFKIMKGLRATYEQEDQSKKELEASVKAAEDRMSGKAAKSENSDVDMDNFL